MADSKKKYSRVWKSNIIIEGTTHNMFKEYCKLQDVEMKEAANEILLFIVKNKIPLNSLSDMMDKNIIKEVKKNHHYTAGFLQSFQQKQLELINKIASVDGKKGWLEGGILRVYLKEIYFILQHVLINSPDEKTAKIFLDENEVNIKKAGMNEVDNVWDKGGVLRVLLEEIYRDVLFIILDKQEDEGVKNLLKDSAAKIKKALNDNKN